LQRLREAALVIVSLRKLKVDKEVAHPEKGEG
jgi:hypothetical protein